MKLMGFWRALSLALLLLFAQQLMLVHGVEHVADLDHGHGEQAEISCHDCLAFNHLPDAPRGQSTILSALDLTACQVAGLVLLQVHCTACIAYSIRAPPSLPKQA
jgi:hypothetical protein